MKWNQDEYPIGLLSSAEQSMLNTPSSLEEILKTFVLNLKSHPDFPLLSDKEKDEIDIYISEAFFGLDLFETDFYHLIAEARNREIIAMEVGSGIGLLSLLLASSGVKVIEVEPSNNEFSRMKRFNNLLASSNPLSRETLVTVNKPIEEVNLEEKIDFVYSLNVLEHIKNPYSVISKLAEQCKPGGNCHFIFPNYTFPYEPHFNVITLFSKSLTQFVYNKKIRSSLGEVFWENLSWPTYRRLKYSHVDLPANVSLEFSKGAAFQYLDRLSNDEFSKRKGLIFKSLSKLIPLLKIALHIIPKAIIPVIDLRIRQTPT